MIPNMKTNLPFTEEIKNDYYIRTFNSDVIEEDLKWHRDKEDRIIICEEKTDWKFQKDNQLPICFDNEIFIEKETYHRLLKGNGSITLKIKKLV
jgi:hypothetical protein